jgi:hypothetical protein
MGALFISELDGLVSSITGPCGNVKFVASSLTASFEALLKHTAKQFSIRFLFIGERNKLPVGLS